MERLEEQDESRYLGGIDESELRLKRSAEYTLYICAYTMPTKKKGRSNRKKKMNGSVIASSITARIKMQNEAPRSTTDLETL